MAGEEGERHWPGVQRQVGRVKTLTRSAETGGKGEDTDQECRDRWGGWKGLTAGAETCERERKPQTRCAGKCEKGRRTLARSAERVEKVGKH